MRDDVVKVFFWEENEDSKLANSCYFGSPVYFVSRVTRQLKYEVCKSDVTLNALTTRSDCANIGIRCK